MMKHSKAEPSAEMTMALPSLFCERGISPQRTQSR